MPFLYMPAAGVEPALPLGERDFKSRASANSAMPAGICKDLNESNLFGDSNPGPTGYEPGALTN